jgi:membrane peptidoglycan carboxypeptidase
MVGGVVAVLLLAGLGYELYLPSVSNAEAKTDEMVRAHHGALSRLPLPSKLGDAVVAVEDEHFYSNVVINVFDGVGRAALASLQSKGDPAGSTIDQQLAKQLYGQGTGISGSLRDLALGVKLSLAYSPNSILEMYLNVVYYGNHFWGDVAAARGYFGLAPDHLDWAQAAMLAGLPQAPSAYDPLHHFALAKQRQLHVLSQLVANHYLTRVAARAVFREPLNLRRTPGGTAG